MNNLVFGKYIPLHSPIHDMDPRAKILALFIFLIAIFIPAGWIGYAIIGVVLLMTLLVSKIPPKFILKALKPMSFMMVFLLVVNVISTRTGELWLEFGFIHIYSEAIYNTLYIFVRLILMVMLTTMLTATTKPLELTLGLEYLMKPLAKIKVPTHEISMMISIALRFIPTIIEETVRIMNAQKSRGVNFEEGKLKEKVTAVLSLIVPLFSVAFQRADDLADAMEARGYVPDAQRTRYKELHYRTKDFAYLFVAVACLGLTILSAVIL